LKDVTKKRRDSGAGPEGEKKDKVCWLGKGGGPGTRV